MPPFENIVTGAPWQPPYAVEWNRLMELATAQSPEYRPEPAGSENSPNLVRVRNSTGTELRDRAIVALNGVVFEASDDEPAFVRRPTFELKLPVPQDDYERIVVLAQPLGIGDIGRAYTHGIIAARVEINDSAHDRATVVNGETLNLESSFHGSAKIIHASDGTSTSATPYLHDESGTSVIDEGGFDELGHEEETDSDANWCLIQFPNFDTVELKGVTAEAIDFDGSGLVNVWRDGANTTLQETAHLNWMHGSQNISSNKQVLMRWFTDENKWIIVGAECED